MPGNQPDSPCGESMVLGIQLFSPISSVAGSSTLILTQPLLTGRVFQSSAVIIGADIILLIAHRFFGVKSVPMLDLVNDQTVQLPLSELQDFLRWMTNGSDSSLNINNIPNRRLINSDAKASNGIQGGRGFLTPESPEAPLVIALYVIGNYSNKPYTPIVELIFPIIALPGVRGALPLLIVGLLATIFVRAVVPPETSGSKPLVKPVTSNNKDGPLTFTPNELLQLLTRFGKHFGSK